MAAPCTCTGVIFQKLELIHILVVCMWANVFWRWRHIKLLHRANATISIPLLITVWDILHWLMSEVIIPKQWPWKFVLNFLPFQPFLGKEWLVKTNSSSSTPYLFVSVAHDSSYPNINQELPYCQNAHVFRNLSPLPSIWHALCYSRIPNLSGVKVITNGYPPWVTSDLLSWSLHGLELTSQQIARRWRKCNSRAPPPFATREDEDEWRASILELLKKVHTIGGVDALAFEVALTDLSVSLPLFVSSLIVNRIILGCSLLTQEHFFHLAVGDLFCRP